MRRQEPPVWMRRAEGYLGIAEAPGPGDDPRIVQFFRDVGREDIVHDEVAWCAAFVGACLERSGIRSTRSLMARSYLKWGVRLDIPRPGCVAVLRRGADPAAGHCAFFVRQTAGKLLLLGGNQGDRVSIAAFPASSLIGYRWPEPASVGTATTGAPTGDAAAFAAALRHVLTLEGGWSDHPADPGGPTNHGITLATLAAWRRVEITAQSRPGLVAELKTVPALTVEAIYREAYWRAARCHVLPAPVALMQFDTAVNQGPLRAMLILQEALGVTVDGEIGPRTLAATFAADQAALVRTCAAIRRRRYRQTRNFVRFGRGWLNRVERTEVAALQLAADQPRQLSPAPSRSQPQKEITTMQTEPKWWGQSMTIWGALLTALSTVLPLIGPLVGLDISAAMVRELGAQVVVVLQALGGLIGTVMTIYGRARAVAPLSSRPMTLNI